MDSAQRETGTVAELVAAIEPAKPQGAPEGNQNAVKKDPLEDVLGVLGSRTDPVALHGTVKGEENKGANSTIVSRKARGSTKAETIIARLKRDAATDAQAGALLGSVASGDIKPYRAAVEMGWVRPMKSIPVDSAESATHLDAWR